MLINNLFFFLFLIAYKGILQTVKEAKKKRLPLYWTKFLTDQPGCFPNKQQ